MKNPNLGRNQRENNPMWGKTHTEETKKAMSESQILRYKAINRLLFKLREDQLEERIEKILHRLYSIPT